MQEKNEDLGIVVRLTVDSMKQQMVQRMDLREKTIKEALEKIFKGENLLLEIEKEVLTAMSHSLSYIVESELRERVRVELGKNKEIKKMIDEVISKNKNYLKKQAGLALKRMYQL